MYIMSKAEAKMFACIDDYILVSPKQHSEQYFQHLMSLLTDLGLPSNPDKQTSPCRKLTCLGIQIDLDANTLSIHPEKLHSIHAECLTTSSKRQLTKTAFQSLLASYCTSINVHVQLVHSLTECWHFLERIPQPER